MPTHFPHTAKVTAISATLKAGQGFNLLFSLELRKLSSIFIPRSQSLAPYALTCDIACTKTSQLWKNSSK